MTAPDGNTDATANKRMKSSRRMTTRLSFATAVGVAIAFLAIASSATQQKQKMDMASNPFAQAAAGNVGVVGGDQCFCKLEGQIDDCVCSVDTVDHFNNMKIYPRLQSILLKPFFRYFQYNPNKPCPFWDMASGKCASPNCGVKSCQPDEIPPGLKGDATKAKADEACEDDDDEDLDASVDSTISDQTLKHLAEWREYDENESRFCEVDEDQCPDCDYVDLTINPERFTGYSGPAAHRIWKAVYEENCFSPPAVKGRESEVPSFSKAFMPDKLEDLCLEKRAFYRAVSGLHSSITIHLCANYLKRKSDSPFASPVDKWGPNLELFQERFDPLLTDGQGPYWLRNLYFVYLLELRALTKAAPYLEYQTFYTGKTEEDKDTQIAVKELLNLMRTFPDQFDESVMFAGNGSGAGSVAAAKALKKEFQEHFRNISRVMDCVGCDKCKLWGKLQVTGLGTALKILFSEGNRSLLVPGPPAMPSSAIGEDLEAAADRMQRLQPPGKPVEIPDFGLTRNEIVALFNAFGRISTSIQQLENFRQMMQEPQKNKKMKDEL